MYATQSKLTFESATAKLGNRDSKKLENNTYLIRVDDSTLAVKLHNTNVVLIHANGRYTLTSGGWQTMTTKDRINEYSPARISTRNQIWYIGETIYQDGIQVDSDGNVLSRTRSRSKVEKTKAKLDKMVREYIKGFAEDALKNGIATPGSGDCWPCLFAGKTLGTDTMGVNAGVDHLLSHFEEKYYVPSLLWNAIGQKPVLWQMIQGDLQQDRTQLLKRELTAYFRRLKPRLLNLLV